MARFNKYPGAQAEFVKWTKSVYMHLSNSLIDFINFDAVRFNTSYLTDFSNAITICQDTLDNETLIDLQSARTINVEKAMAMLRDNYRDLRYFVKKVFPNNEARQNAYGFDSYGEAAYNDAELAKFVRQLLMLLAIDQMLFTAQGWTQTHTDNLTTNLKDLDLTVAQKALGSSGNLISTADRTVLFDALWQFTADTREAAHRVYKNDPVRLSLYLIPVRRSSSSDANISTTTARIALSNILADTLLSVNNIGTVPIMIWVGSNVSDPRPNVAQIIAPSETWTGTADKLTNGAVGNLFVANDDKKVAGKYEAVVLDTEE